MEWESMLLGTPTDQWLVDQVVALDWYDGPRGGVCSLAHPTAEFFFDLVDEQQDSNGLDVRFFRLARLPHGSVRQLLTALEPLGPPTKPVWCPTWRFSSMDAQTRAEKMIAEIEHQATGTNLVVSSADLIHFTSCRGRQAISTLPPSLVSEA